MTSFPGSPRLSKGALVAVNSNRPQKTVSVIRFQYNPDSLTRRLDTRAAESKDAGDRSEALRLKGPPKEILTLTIEIDAVDQAETATLSPTGLGVYPTLVALELLLYPASKTVIQNAGLAAASMLEIIPAESPLTLLIWGNQRVLPVRLTNLSITEEAFDTRLNPLRAKVELSLQVLSYYDLQASHFGHNLFLAQQIAKEALAKTETSAVASRFRLPTTVLA